VNFTDPTGNFVFAFTFAEIIRNIAIAVSFVVNTLRLAGVIESIPGADNPPDTNLGLAVLAQGIRNLIAAIGSSSSGGGGGPSGFRNSGFGIPAQLIQQQSSGVGENSGAPRSLNGSPRDGYSTTEEAARRVVFRGSPPDLSDTEGRPPRRTFYLDVSFGLGLGIRTPFGKIGFRHQNIGKDFISGQKFVESEAGLALGLKGKEIGFGGSTRADVDVIPRSGREIARVLREQGKYSPYYSVGPVSSGPSETRIGFGLSLPGVSIDFGIRSGP